MASSMTASAASGSRAPARASAPNLKSSPIFTWQNALVAAAIVGIILLPYVGNPYYVKVAAIGLIFAYIASAWNIIGGYGGQLSMGHSIFFGIGSYALGLFSFYKVGPLLYAIPLGMAVAFLVAAAIAAVCFKYGLRGLYFAIGTLLLAEMVRLIAVNWEPLGRSQGISIVVEPGVLNLKFDSVLPLYYIILAAVAGIVMFTHWLQRSRLGFQLIALREQDDSAQALGIDTNRSQAHRLHHQRSTDRDRRQPARGADRLCRPELRPFDHAGLDHGDGGIAWRSRNRLGTDRRRLPRRIDPGGTRLPWIRDGDGRCAEPRAHDLRPVLRRHGAGDAARHRGHLHPQPSGKTGVRKRTGR